jgi:hypothetical protein
MSSTDRPTLNEFGLPSRRWSDDRKEARTFAAEKGEKDAIEQRDEALAERDEERANAAAFCGEKERLKMDSINATLGRCEQKDQVNTHRRCKVKKSSKPYVIVRTRSAGVFAGTLESRTGMEAVMTNARRIWYWQGAASLSQLAMTGTSKPAGCKFPPEVTRVVLTEVIEILDVTPEARASISSVKPWTA